ncbi:MAG: Tyrosine--tRNA ligase, mitochondrial [Chrysothrix sp. TS-e1954]|nr:MAG: Tyrosine--tRNA ligase, mitochondrial [Chrysothrix sp. TS-e1954]
MSRNPRLLPEILKRRKPWICPDCRQRRTFKAMKYSTSWLQKQQEAKEQWDGWAQEIRDGKKQDPLALLDKRGYVNAVAGEREAVKRLLIDKRIGVYCGIDPTARSLHLGHLVPIMALFWMHVQGFKTISLIGASTAKVGDPTGRTTDRREMTSTERKSNIVSIHYQMKKLWGNLEKLARKHGHPPEKYWHRGLVNNAHWWGKETMVEVLKLMGSGMRMGAMLSRDTVKTKMSSDTGMSFAEFCYPVMQAWDWWHMYHTRGIQMQIGGSDQFGNIVAGIEAVKHVAKTHPDQETRQEGGVTPLTAPCGFTVPLLTSPSGEKFGKSAGNAIWFDDSMTNLFDLYGYFIRIADSNVERYLKLFTFLPLNKIESVVEKHKNDPSKRVAQHTLACEVVELIHGAEAAKNAAAQHEAFFAKGKTIADLAAAQGAAATVHKMCMTTAPGPNPLKQSADKYKQREGTYISPSINPYAPQVNGNNAPVAHLVLPKSLIYNQPIAKVFYAAGLVSSRSEGHRLASQKGAYIGRTSSGQMGEDLSFIPAKVADPSLTWDNVIRDEQSGQSGEEGLLVLRSGKWNVRVARIVSDQKFEELGLPPPPAWEEWLSQRTADKAEAADSRATRQEQHKKEWEKLSEQDAQEESQFNTLKGRQKDEHRYQGHQKGWDTLQSFQKGWDKLKSGLESRNPIKSPERRPPSNTQAAPSGAQEKHLVRRIDNLSALESQSEKHNRFASHQGGRTRPTLSRRGQKPHSFPWDEEDEYDQPPRIEEETQRNQRLNAAHVPKQQRRNPAYQAVRQSMSREDLTMLRRKKAMLVKEEARQTRAKSEMEGKEAMRELVRRRRRVKDLRPGEIEELE